MRDFDQREYLSAFLRNEAARARDAYYSGGGLMEYQRATLLDDAADSLLDDVDSEYQLENMGYRIAELEEEIGELEKCRTRQDKQ